MKSFDTGLFIDTIQSNPSLYNQSHPDYKDPAKKYRIWQEIAQQFLIPSGDAAKAKWRNVRDSYVKHLKSLKMGNPKRKYSSWPWSDKMEFLIPYVTGRQVLVDNLDGDQSIFMKHESWDDVHTVQPEPVLQDEPSQDHMMRSTVHCPDYMECVKVELTDPTDLMMLSHARRIRGFTRKRQVQLGMRIAQLVMEAELEEIAEDEASSSNAQSQVQTQSQPWSETEESINRLDNS